MMGAIAGDVIGSVYERAAVRHKAFALFPDGHRATDDSVLTIALAQALLDGDDLATVLRAHHRRYPEAGWGPTFRAWAEAPPGTPAPASATNGAVMRISPVAWVATSMHEALALAERCTVLTHDHPEAVRGAQAVVAATFLARQGAGPAAIAAHVSAAFGYDLSVPLDALRPGFGFDLACASTVPAALRAFLEAADYEDAVRNAVSLGGDADTLAAVAGAVAEAHFGGVPAPIARRAFAVLDADQQAVVRRFAAAHRVPLAVD